MKKYSFLFVVTLVFCFSFAVNVSGHAGHDLDSNHPSPSSEAARVMVDDRMETMKEKNLEAKEQMQLRKEEFKDRVEENRADLKSRITEKRENLKDRLEQFKDQRKARLVERIDQQIDQLNERLTNHLSDILDKFDGLLTRIENFANDHGINSDQVAETISDAHTAVERARNLIAEQAGKTYALTITDEETVKEEVGEIHQLFRTDMKIAFDAVKAAQQAIREAAVAVGSAVESSPSASPSGTPISN
jgi:hypothetical protein